MVDDKIAANIGKDDVTTSSMQIEQGGQKADCSAHGDTQCKQKHRGFECLICYEDFLKLGK